MTTDQWTTKAREALRDAQRLAEEHHHGEVDALHLVLALVRQEGGVVPSVLEKIGVKSALFADVLDRQLRSRPQVQGEGLQRGVARELQGTLEAAAKLAAQMKDEYVSAEHLFLAALGRKGGEVARVAGGLGITVESVLQALQAVRGSRRVTDEEPEDKYEALKKYGRDLTADARAGPAGSGDRPRRGDPPRGAGALAAHQEQSGADRRAGRGQDGDRGRAGAAHRGGRRARGPQEQARGGARSRRDARGGQVPRGIRGPLQGVHQGGH
jgi:hypothetical protein